MLSRVGRTNTSVTSSGRTLWATTPGVRDLDGGKKRASKSMKPPEGGGTPPDTNQPQQLHDHVQLADLLAGVSTEPARKIVAIHALFGLSMTEAPSGCDLGCSCVCRGCASSRRRECQTCGLWTRMRQVPHIPPSHAWLTPSL